MGIKVINGQIYTVQRVYRFGGSMGIFLPRDWALAAGIDVGSEVLLTIVPVKGTGCPKLEIVKFEDTDKEVSS